MILDARGRKIVMPHHGAGSATGTVLMEEMEVEMRHALRGAMDVLDFMQLEPPYHMQDKHVPELSQMVIATLRSVLNPIEQKVVMRQFGLGMPKRSLEEAARELTMATDTVRRIGCEAGDKLLQQGVRAAVEQHMFRIVAHDKRPLHR